MTPKTNLNLKHQMAFFLEIEINNKPKQLQGLAVTYSESSVAGK